MVFRVKKQTIKHLLISEKICGIHESPSPLSSSSCSPARYSDTETRSLVSDPRPINSKFMTAVSNPNDLCCTYYGEGKVKPTYINIPKYVQVAPHDQMALLKVFLLNLCNAKMGRLISHNKTPTLLQY